MKNFLCEFTDDRGTFVSEKAHQINTLYFPLCNSSPFMSCVSATLRGDIKVDFHSFLLEPVSRIDLSNLKSSRNFWIYINPVLLNKNKLKNVRKGGVNPQKIWSITGLSKNISLTENDEFKLEAGLLWQKITRQNKKIGLRAEILSFVPASGEPAEIMYADLTNISAKSIKFTPTAAIPIFGRSANNLHDHRHVTSLLNRIRKEKFGITVCPTLTFDESGHRKNNTSYFVWGIDKDYRNPQYIYSTQEEFTGDGSDLGAPRAIFDNLLPDKHHRIQGKEAMAGLRFRAEILKPGQSHSYIILMGITKNKNEISRIFHKFNTPDKIKKAQITTAEYWYKKGTEISLNSQNNHFDNWFRWVNIQPYLRKIFGCSFLPDFDYGRGGRGWRDLWQDCLYLTLTNTREVRNLLINNFSGVRIDGSNATIIGQEPGEFIADRNNISRVWMDHGIWPLMTTLLYIHQSGDLKILTEETTYFRDRQLSRSQEIDENWKPEYGKQLKTKEREIYTGTILEHILVQNLVQFFNVGPHNHIRLENADWNDGLDMAYQYGESVTFSAMYAQNLKNLCEMIDKLGQKNIVILKELDMLLDSLAENRVDYSNISEKHKLLHKYFQKIKYQVSGKKISLPASKLINDLKIKADWIFRHIQKNEWLKEGFFNGYYNNDRQKVEGKINGIMRMTLAGQVFPIMSGVASDEQIKVMFKKIKEYLQDKKLGGFHLNTDFKSEQLNLGRAFSFVYGDKENGAFFNHMAVMFAYALYSRGYAREGYRVINSIYQMAQDTERSKIYPCLPEYFNADGRGMYSYLTGSASWLLFTLLTQVFGIRGEYGDFIINPKLVSKQFKTSNLLSITASFAQKRIEVRFLNPHRKDFGEYSIINIIFNKRVIAQNKKYKFFSLPRKKFLSLTNNNYNVIEVLLD